MTRFTRRRRTKNLDKHPTAQIKSPTIVEIRMSLEKIACVEYIAYTRYLSSTVRAGYFSRLNYAKNSLRRYFSQVYTENSTHSTRFRKKYRFVAKI